MALASKPPHREVMEATEDGERGRGALGVGGRRRGAAVAIQGLRAAAMRREEAGGGREGGAEQSLQPWGGGLS